jgi:ribokinase
LLNAAPYHQRATPLLPLVDHLIVNEIEAGQLLDAKPVILEEVDRAAADLRRQGPSVVVITLGEHGAWLSSEDFSVRFVAPSVPVVDSTGAGDAFVGAYAAAVVSGASPQHAVRVAVAAGSLAVQHHGAQASLPTRAAVDDALGRVSG